MRVFFFFHCIWLLHNMKPEFVWSFSWHEREMIISVCDGMLTDGESISISPGETVSFTGAVPCLGVSFVSNLYFHLVQARRQHGEKTGDVCRRPLHSDTHLPVHEHHAVIGLFSQVGTLDGENSMTYTKGNKKITKFFFFLHLHQGSFCQSSATIICTCHLFSVSLPVVFSIIAWADTWISDDEV